MADYQDQYRRVKRWYTRFEEIDAGREFNRTSNYYEDSMYAFFQNCYHLKDWLKNDPASGVGASEVEGYVNSSSWLRICADICNGSKHLKLKTPKVDSNTRMESRHYNLQLGGAEPKLSVKYQIASGGKEYNAFDLAQKCMGEWDKFLRKKGLAV